MEGSRGICRILLIDFLNPEPIKIRKARIIDLCFSCTEYSNLSTDPATYLCLEFVPRIRELLSIPTITELAFRALIDFYSQVNSSPGYLAYCRFIFWLSLV